MLTLLAAVAGLCWTVTYLLIIRRGFADRTYGMPVVALCANLAWEFIFAVVRPHPGVQRAADLVWLGLDLVIAVTLVRFGPAQFGYLPRWACYAGFGVTLVLAYLAVDLVSREFDAGRSTYVGFGQNLVMSGLFLAMLAARRGLAGQSVGIAVGKLLGTAVTSWYAWAYLDGYGYEGSRVLPFMYLAILLLDLGYLVAVVLVGRATGWRRRPPVAPPRPAALVGACAS